MANFLLLAIVGLIAQLVDGSLGMAYGVTSQSLLLTIGIAPALASASVHIAEVGTTAASGVSHWRFKNVDWAKVWPLAIPGAIGAFFGAVVLSSFITAEAAEPIVAIFLFGLGVFVLARFSFRRHERPVQVRPVSRSFLAPLGLIAGFLDRADGPVMVAASGIANERAARARSRSSPGHPAASARRLPGATTRPAGGWRFGGNSRRSRRRAHLHWRAHARRCRYCVHAGRCECQRRQGHAAARLVARIQHAAGGRRRGTRRPDHRGRPTAATAMPPRVSWA